MSKSIAQMFPELDDDREKRIQADIPYGLYERAEKIRKQRKLKWNQIMIGLLDKFVEELAPTRKTNF